VASTSGLAVMMAIPAQFGAGVTVAMLPPLSAGREEWIVAPMSPARGALGSPMRFGLEEDEGALWRLWTWRPWLGRSPSPRRPRLGG
jgi:hypothetical protein